MAERVAGDRFPLPTAVGLASGGKASLQPVAMQQPIGIEAEQVTEVRSNRA